MESSLPHTLAAERMRMTAMKHTHTYTHTADVYLSITIPERRHLLTMQETSIVLVCHPSCSSDNVCCAETTNVAATATFTWEELYRPMI